MEWSFLFFLNSALLGVGLAMDAFSVSMANGLHDPGMSRKRMCIIAGTFGVFQAVMPMTGWVCVHTIVEMFSSFETFIPWIALALLGYIGGKMLIEGIRGEDTEEAAALTGLLPGTPVIGGMFDIDACALAVNVTDETNICMIAGTWSINEYPRRAPVTDGTVLMNSLFCLPGYYLIEESSPTSAGNNQWFIDRLLPELKAEAKAAGRSIYDVLNEWVGEFSPEDFVPVFLPFLTASNVDPRARAAFVGLNASHSRKELARAVYEGIAFSHRYHLDRLMRSRPDRSGTIRLAGGAARSEVWTQMFADVMDMPVETVSADETGALGCCVAVAAALGDYADAADAAAHMCRSARRVLPRPEAAKVYAEKYALYLKTIECLDPLWAEMQRFMEEHHA